MGQYLLASIFVYEKWLGLFICFYYQNGLCNVIKSQVPSTYSKTNKNLQRLWWSNILIIFF